ncbi:MAG TPA: hypothetical protein VG389_22360 [Myxococcota bacterium]|jgi:hypothetical protein|nr:hypothetical protein [Myxococcota bacterium]
MTSCKYRSHELRPAAALAAALALLVPVTTILWNGAARAAAPAPTAAPAPASVSAGAKAGPPGPGGGMPDEMRAKIEHRIKTMRAMFLTEALDLDEPTAKRLFAVLDKHDVKRKGLLIEREKLVRDLRAAGAKVPASDAEVDALIDKILKNRLAEEALNAAVLADVRPVLSAQQRARLVLALPRFYNKVRKLIHDAKKDMVEKALEDEDVY